MSGRMYDDDRGSYGYGSPRRGPIETKPFFLTSEFLATLLGIIAVAITAAAATDIDSRLATKLITGLIAAYTLSRGIAKAGTKSRSADPREDLLRRAAEPRRETAASR